MNRQNKTRTTMMLVEERCALLRVLSGILRITRLQIELAIGEYLVACRWNAARDACRGCRHPDVTYCRQLAAAFTYGCWDCRLQQLAVQCPAQCFKGVHTHTTLHQQTAGTYLRIVVSRFSLCFYTYLSTDGTTVRCFLVVSCRSLFCSVGKYHARHNISKVEEVCAYWLISFLVNYSC